MSDRPPPPPLPNVDDIPAKLECTDCHEMIDVITEQILYGSIYGVSVRGLDPSGNGPQVTHCVCHPCLITTGDRLRGQGY